MLPGSVVPGRSEGSGHADLTPFGRRISARITELRANDSRVTHERIAGQAGISRQHLYRALRGRTELTVFEVAQLARVLTIPLTEMYDLYWEGRGRATWTFAEMMDMLRPFGYEPMTTAPTVREAGATYRDALPRELLVMAEEFKLDALRQGADDHELAFIASVLASPEAIFRQSGFQDHTLTAIEQKAELEGVIAMLRQWLETHMRKRGAWG